MSRRVARSEAAWARPRPSATASARLANSTVSHSQTVIHQANTLGSVIAMTVVSTAPTSTTNITGLCHNVRGSSLRSASGSEVNSDRGLKLPELIRCSVAGSGWGASVVMTVPPRWVRARAPAGR